MATMKDVARDAGVSIYTVSATLSGSANVSAELRARVTESVSRLGYERNSTARGLKRGTSSLLGLIVSDVTNPYFTELVEHIQDKAHQTGYSVLLGISDHDVDREAELLALMRSHQAAGTILCPAGGEEDYADGRLSRGRMRLIAVDNTAPGLGVDTVCLDNRVAADLAVSHLLELGHHRIGVVAGMRQQYVSRERLAGRDAALARAGIASDPELVTYGDFRLEEGHACGRALLTLASPPTAIFVANNLMLIGVMRALAEAGVRVPDDMSVCSIDDFPWAPAFQPALTVVRQPIAAMAEAAFERLVERLGGDDGPATARDFAPELVVRRSCASIGNG
ncbi:MAG: LacI family DNA-binding transcriptional regulator [Bauldia sp.]|nr:LacI family DNA-binding transcriptional regulator [Bauldia sp.]